MCVELTLKMNGIHSSHYLSDVPSSSSNDVDLTVSLMDEVKVKGKLRLKKQSMVTNPSLEVKHESDKIFAIFLLAPILFKIHHLNGKIFGSPNCILRIKMHYAQVTVYSH
jgi:hypothetical protein